MKRRFEEFDRVFFFTLLLILLSGLVVVYSACQSEDPTFRLDAWKRQILFAAVGMIGFALCASIPPVAWERLSPALYLVSLIGLVAVLLAGSSGGGATRWIALGSFRFQPSEVAKVASVLLLARTLAGRRRTSENLASLAVPLLIMLVPMALTLRQPDLGTALVFLVAVPPMLFWSGVSLPYLLLASSPVLSVLCASSLVSWIIFAAFLLFLAYRSRALLLERILYVLLSVGAGIVTPVLWNRMATYQQQRIIAFLDPARYSSGAGYQIIQSKVALGSGGLTGVGWLDGTQKGLAFLPARHTDFIFSVVGEEFGFLGTMTLLALFTLLLIRGFRIAAAARDSFASLTVVGILSMLAFQVFVNIGVTLGLVPVTGLPLPIYSYGGTSMLSTLAALGIVLGVGMRRRI
ncbi:MAG: rod shape-determining protein RodA [Gemmatimonadota bacterium]|nr:MAG: rod shape-determining protein RodA [Gemmatimonadota bacterium]